MSCLSIVPSNGARRHHCRSWRCLLLGAHDHRTWRDIFHAPLPVTEDLFLCGFIRRTVARLMLIWSCFFVCFSVCLAGESQLCRCRAALTYARQTWPMISASALACHTYFSVPHLLQRATPTSACHTYCDTGRPYTWASPRTRATHTCCGAFRSGAVTTRFNDLICLSQLGIEPRSQDRCEANALPSHRGGLDHRGKKWNMIANHIYWLLDPW